jgi:hypothetical protein
MRFIKFIGFINLINLINVINIFSRLLTPWKTIADKDIIDNQLID